MKGVYVLIWIFLASFLTKLNGQIRFRGEDYVDVLYIKKGSAQLVYGPIVKGLIVEIIPDSTISILTLLGAKLTFMMKDVEKVAREKVEKLWEPEREENETEETSFRKVYRTRKEPAVALALSLLIPGAGQMYNGDVGLGALMFLGTLGGYVIALTSKNEDGIVLGVCSAFFFSIWSIINAPSRASQINKEAGFTLRCYPYKRGLQFSVVYNIPYNK